MDYLLSQVSGYQTVGGESLGEGSYEKYFMGVCWVKILNSGLFMYYLLILKIVVRRNYGLILRLFSICITNPEVIQHRIRWKDDDE